MFNKETIVPGCANCNFFNRICSAVYEKAVKPTLAKQDLIENPAVIEGPPAPLVNMWVCDEGGNPEKQKACSDFSIRTTADDERDENI